MTENGKDTPGIVMPPPLVFLVALAAGFLLDRAVPVNLDPAPAPVRVAGLALLVLGGALMFAGLRTFMRAGTAFRPDHPATRLLTAGPFRYTRNPLYIALTLVYLGIALAAAKVWPVATLVPALVVIRYRVIAREEAYLERKFGDAYRDYKSRVRRWL
jgi:protein-S-isoprenylcysteine O-methyltransferase Ste14